MKVRNRTLQWRHLAPIHTWRATATIVLVLVPIIAIGALMIRGNRSADVPNLKPPKGASAATLPAPTTTLASLTGISLGAVNGTTTSAPVRTTGSARLSGTVSGPAGPLASAVVHIERVDQAFAVDVAAGGDGRYSFAGLAGGRYRVRAYLPPSYAQTEPEIFFLRDGEDRAVDVAMEQFNAMVITAALAPDPPTSGQPFNLVVRVATRAVDGDGVVRTAPVVGATVVMTSTGNVVFAGLATATTGGDGTVTYLVSCKAPGPLGLSGTVKATAADPGQPLTLELSACVPPPTTTTTTAPAASTTTTTVKAN